MRSTARVLAVLTLLTVWGLPFAHTAEHVLLINDSGAWVTTIGETGPPVQIRIDPGNIIDARTGEKPDKPDKPDETIAGQVEEWAREVNDPTTAAGLAEVYRIGAGNLESGKVTNSQSLQLVKMLTDAVLKRQKAEEKWAPWRANVGELITEEVQEGDYGHETLSEIAKGLDASHDDMAFGDGEILKQILEFIIVILPFILEIIAGLG